MEVLGPEGGERRRICYLGYGEGVENRSTVGQEERVQEAIRAEA
jgi:hypothetical protein